MDEPRGEYGTCLLVPWLKSPHSELKVSRNNRNVRCRLVLCEKLPKANASEPRRHASPALRCRVDMNPDEVYGHERPQRRVRTTCHHHRRMLVVVLVLVMPTNRGGKTHAQEE